MVLRHRRHNNKNRKAKLVASSRSVINVIIQYNYTTFSSINFDTINKYIQHATSTRETHWQRKLVMEEIFFNGKDPHLYYTNFIIKPQNHVHTSII